MIYVLENDYLKAYVSDLGATLVKLIEKKTGRDIVLGYESDQEYIDNVLYLGASVGRNANRIGNAKFALGGKEYQLAANDNMNSLHGGGINGFSFKTWHKEEETKEELVLSYYSKDGEEGFPGNLRVEVTYKLDKNNLIWSYNGHCDQDTIFNMTNHSYFNLGDDDIYNLDLKITTDKYSPVDEYGLTLDEVKPVESTPFDFREFRNVKSNIDKLANGIDNNYVWETMEDKLVATLKNEAISMNVYTDMPDMHLYTGNFLNGSMGKYGKPNKKHAGLCLECQFYPNAINYSNYIKPILKKDMSKSHYIKYEINVL